MNTEVSVKAALNREPVVLRAGIANGSSNTQISKRLAKRLGLNSVQDAFITDTLQINGPVCLKWKISLQPILITVKALDENKTKVVYPIINCNEGDAFWEMIIGQDWSDFMDLFDELCKIPRREHGSRPTPGPGWRENTIFMGHNLRLIHNITDFLSPPDLFFEYLCFDSEAIKRIATNKVTQQLVVIFRDSTTVYLYDGVSSRFVDRIDAGESKGQVVGKIKQACSFSTIQNFPPRTVLLTDGKFF